MIIFIFILFLFAQVSTVSLAVIPEDYDSAFVTGTAAGSSASTRTSDTGDDLTKWTVMVYMAADNNLEYYGVEDMNELEHAGSSQEVNIIVQFDRHEDDNIQSGYTGSNGDWSDTRRFYVEYDEDPENSTITPRMRICGSSAKRTWPKRRHFKSS